MSAVELIRIRSPQDDVSAVDQAIRCCLPAPAELSGNAKTELSSAIVQKKLINATEGEKKDNRLTMRPRKMDCAPSDKHRRPAPMTGFFARWI